MIARTVHRVVRTSSGGLTRSRTASRLVYVLTLAAAFLFATTASSALAQDKPATGEPPKAKKKKKEGARKEKKTDEKKTADGKKKKKEGKTPKTKAAGDTAAGAGDKEEEDLAGGTPVVKVIEPKFDFGTVWAGPDLRHSFTIKNEGDGLLEIIRVKPACGCTQTGKYNNKLKPGESTDIPFKLKSTSLARSKGGKFSKSITITTNDKKNSSIKLLLTGTARFRVSAPSLISFGTVKADVQKDKTITITNNTETPLELTMPETQVTSKTPFKYELSEKEAGKVFELKATTVPPLKEGRVSTELLIATNIKEQKEIKIRVTINVPPRIQVRPSMIVYNPKRLTVPVTVTNNGLTDVKVVGATTDDPALNVTIDELKPGRNYTLKVTFPKNYKPPKGNRKLTIKTDDPEKSEIVIPIRPPRVPKPRPAKLLEGKPAPSFELKTVAGKSLNNKQLADSKAVVMTFWAADCPYCKKALPRIDSLRKEFAPKGVRFINVAETMRKRYTDDQLKDVLKTLKVEGELVTDQDNKLGPKFKATSYPTMFVLGGKSGKVEMVSIGNVTKLESDLSKKLKELTSGKKAAAKTDGTAQTGAVVGSTTFDTAAGTTTTVPPDKAGTTTTVPPDKGGTTTVPPDKTGTTTVPPDKK